MVKIHLSRLLGEKRWTQKDLADATGIRPSTINEWYHELVPRLNVVLESDRNSHPKTSRINQSESDRNSQS